MRGRPPRRFDYRGRKLTLDELAALSGIKRSTMRYRLVNLGLPAELATRKFLEKPCTS